MVYINLCILRHLKEELPWVIDGRLWVVSNKMLFRTVMPLRKLKKKIVLNSKQYCMRYYVTLSNVFSLNNAYGTKNLLRTCWSIIRYVFVYSCNITI